jgi:hypothetical protein
MASGLSVQHDQRRVHPVRARVVVRGGAIGLNKSHHIHTLSTLGTILSYCRKPLLLNAMDAENSQEKPVERNKKRRPLQLIFDSEGYVKDWAYLVTRAFYPALDVILSDRVKTLKNQDGSKRIHKTQEWTEGAPPLLAFRDTDTLPSRAVLPGTTSLNLSLAKVVQATPDSLDGRVIVSGTVGFKLFEWQTEPKGAYKDKGLYICTQTEFLKFLQSGIPPKALNSG